MKPALAKFLAFALGLLCLSGGAAEVIPPVPTQYFNDNAGVVAPATAARLNEQLAQFERDAYSQILVAIFPKLQSDFSVEDYCVRVFNSWHVGQKDKNNGAVLFVFVQDHKMFLQTGYGLEGALPDVTCKRIIEDEIKPHFKAQDFDGGLTAGVSAILAAAKGEYHGTGHTVADGKANRQSGGSIVTSIIVFFIVMFILARMRRGGGLLSTAGWLLTNTGGSNWSGGGNSGGGWSGGGGGGFSSGGGSSGGGGAGGSW